MEIGIKNKEFREQVFHFLVFHLVRKIVSIHSVFIFRVRPVGPGAAASAGQRQ